MTNIFCVRADFGTYAKQFVEGGYAAIGWIDETDLSDIATRDELYPLYKKSHPKDTSNIVIGQQVGQIARFLLEVKAGDYVITPAADTEWLHYGKIEADPSYFFVGNPTDGCPFHHRRRVTWSANRLKRSELSVPLQNTIRSSLTVFAISQQDEFFTAIGETSLVSQPVATAYDPHRVVLEQVLQLDDKEFEVLITHLEPVQEQLRRVGQARFERRPTNLAFLDGVVHRVVGRRGEAPLVPPYKTRRSSWTGSY